LGENKFDIAKVYFVTPATAQRVQYDGQCRCRRVDTGGQVKPSIA
jgi:hypothetical protein